MIKTKKNRLNRNLIAIAVSASLVSPLSIAQEAAEEEVEKIAVTGSRLKQDQTLDAASPVLEIGGADIKTSGQLDLGALLRESPQLQASLPGSFSAFNGTPLGASLLNLRNLGSERTLVLEDGRRHVAGIEGTGSVDVNTISTALIRNVEVLTGGASAVYGADAVTGVVNFVMRDGSTFEGLEVRSQAGVSSEGDANEFFLSIANGFSSDDGRGDLVFAVEYQETSPVFAGDRDFAGLGLFGRVPNNQATQDALGVDAQFSNTYINNYRLPISSDQGVISLTGSAFVSVLLSGGTPGCSALGNAQIAECQTIGRDGQLRPYNPGDIYVGAFDASGGDGVPVDPDNELILPDSQRLLIQAKSTYDITDDHTFFVDAKFVTSETQETNQVNGFNDDISISLDNPYIPAALLSQINTLEAEGVPVDLVMSRDVLDVSAQSNPIADRKTYRVVAGFEGIVPGTELDYEIAYNYGRTDATIVSRSRIEDRYFAAIDAVVDPDSNEIVCRSTLDPSAIPPTSPFPSANGNFGFLTFQPGAGSSCVPVNLFGADSVSQAAADWIFQPTTNQNELKQEHILAVIAGDSEEWFSLPAGPVSFAFGYEWRRETSEFIPDNYLVAGLTFGTLDSRSGPTNPSSGSYDVSEYFVEAQVPILEGEFLAERLELRTAYRSSDYDPYGTTDAFTVGGVWSPIETFTVRTTYSEAVRVPNINEAFSPTFAATIGAGQDPCNQNFINAGSDFRRDNCIALIGQSVADGTYDSTNFLSAFVAGTTGGNPDLNPEEAETVTVGVVWRPEDEFAGVMDGLVVTLDYYNIQIDGLIDSLSGFDIAQNCVDAPDINNVFCEAVDRDATNGFITDFRSGFINLAAVETSGVDFRTDYSFDLDDATVSLTMNGTKFLKNDEVRDVSAPDEITDVLGTFTRPEWIVNFNADVAFGDFVVGWRGRYESSQLLPGIGNEDVENDPFFSNITETGSAFVHDFSVSYLATEDLEVYGGINNAFNEEPYLATLSRPAGPRGRFFYLGVNYDL